MSPFVSALLPALLVACTAADSGVGDDPYTENSRAGCSRETSWSDADTEAALGTETTRWGTLLDEDGAAYEDEVHRAESSGNTYDLLVEGRVSGDCSAGMEETVVSGGVFSGVREAETCDTGGYWTSFSEDTAAAEDAWGHTGDGTSTNTYDTSGRITRRDLSVTDTSGTSTTTTTYEYDGDLLVRQTVEGDYTTVSTYTYDEADHLVRTEWDGNGDGAPETVFDYTYDGDDLVAVVEDFEDGYAVLESTMTYDAHGRMVSIAEVDVYDGETTEDDVATYTWDDAHYRLTAVEFVDHLDADADYTSTYSYDGGADAGWPWSGTWVNVSATPTTGAFAYTCP